MDGWTSVGILAGSSVTLGILDLYRGQAQDVLAAVATAELGVLLGALLSIVIPGGLVLGALGGVALAWNRLSAIRSNRHRELQASLAEAQSDGEVRLALHDRADALSARTLRWSGLRGILTFGVLGTAAVWSLGAGIWMHSVVATVLGAALAFLPVSVMAERFVTNSELAEVCRALIRRDDPQ